MVIFIFSQLCDWLHVNDKCFQRTLNCDVLQDKTALSAYVQLLVQDYLKTPNANCK